MMKNYILDEKINFLFEMVSNLLDKVEKEIKDGGSADSNVAVKQLFNEIEIDKYEIEEDIIRFIITEAPYGRYLRAAIAILKIVSHVQRINEHAIHLFYLKQLKPTYSKFVVYLENLALITSTMLKQSLIAFRHNSENLENSIIEHCHELEQLKKNILEELLNTKANSSSEQKIYYNIYYLTEEINRIKKHIVEMDKWIVFMDTGVRVKFDIDDFYSL